MKVIGPERVGVICVSDIVNYFTFACFSFIKALHHDEYSHKLPLNDTTFPVSFSPKEKRINSKKTRGKFHSSLRFINDYQLERKADKTWLT